MLAKYVYLSVFIGANVVSFPPNPRFFSEVESYLSRAIKEKVL